MPYVVVDAGKMTKEKKAELCSKVAEITSQCTGAPLQAVTVIIHENEPDNVGVGGKLLSELHK